MGFSSGPSPKDYRNAAVPEAAETPARQRSKIRRFGCAAGILAIVVITLTWLFSDSLLRTYAENKASSALGMPVSVGELRLFLFGRPSITLKNVRLGNDPAFVHLDQINIAFKRLPGFFGKFSVFNIDGGGIGVIISEKMGDGGGTDLSALVEWLRTPHPDWAIPETNLNGVNLLFVENDGTEIQLKAGDLRVKGVASSALQKLYPEIMVHLRDVGISEAGEEYLKIAEFETLIRLDPSGPIIIRNLEIDTPTYMDKMRANSSLQNEPNLRLGRLLKKITSLTEGTGLTSAEPANEITMPSLKIEQFKATAIKTTITDERGGSVNGAFAADISELRLKELSLYPSGQTKLLSLVLNGFEVSASHDNKASAFAASEITLNDLRTADLAKDLPGFNLALKNPSLTSSGPSGTTRISNLGDNQSLLQVMLSPQGYGSGLKVDSFKLDNLNFALPIHKGEGLAVTGDVTSIITSWLDAMGLSPDEETAAAAGEDTPYAIRQIDLRKLSFHLTSPRSEPVNAFDLEGGFEEAMLSGLSSGQTGSDSTKRLPFNCAAMKLTGFSTRIKRAGEPLFILALDSGVTHNLFPDASEGMPPASITLEAPRLSNPGNNESPICAASRINLNFLNDADGGIKIKNALIDQPRLALTINSEKHFAGAEDLRSLIAFMQSCFSPVEESNWKTPATPDSSDNLEINDFKIKNLQATIVDNSQPGDQYTITATLAEGLLIKNAEKSVVGLNDLKVDGYSKGKAGGIFSAGQIVLESLSSDSNQPLAGELRSLSFHSRRPDFPAYVTVEQVGLHSSSLQEIDSLSISNLATNATYNSDTETWDFIKSLEIIEQPVLSILEAMDNLDKPMASAGDSDSFNLTPQLPDLDLGLDSRPRPSTKSDKGKPTDLLQIKQLELSGLKQIFHVADRGRTSTLTFASQLVKADGIKIANQEATAISTDSAAMNPFSIMNFSMDDADLVVEELLNGNGYRPVYYCVKDLWMRCFSLAVGKAQAPGRGILLAGGTVVQTPGDTAESGWITLGLNEIDCRSGLATASFVAEGEVQTLLQKYPELAARDNYQKSLPQTMGINALSISTGVIRPFARREGLDFNDKSGAISALLRGLCYDGNLNMVADVALENVKMEKIGSSSVGIDLLRNFLTMLLQITSSASTISIPEIYTITGTLSSPKAKLSPNAKLKALGSVIPGLSEMPLKIGDILKDLKNDPTKIPEAILKSPKKLKDIFKDTYENSGKQEDPDLDTEEIKPGLEPEQQPETAVVEIEEEPRKKSKAERRIERVKKILEMLGDGK